MLGLSQLNMPLANIGAPNCWLHTDPIVMLAALSNAGGTATMPWLLPASVDSIGLVVTTQGAAFDALANPFGLITTGGRRITLGGWQ